MYLSSAISGTEKRQELTSVLERAGLIVLPADDESELNSPDMLFAALQKADCSVHMISKKATIETDHNVALAREQFHQALKINSQRPDFKIIVWQEGKLNFETLSPKEIDLINEIRNNISNNMVFTDVNSAIQLVDDIRSFVEEKKQVLFDINKAEVFFISNQLDENEANEIIDMLTDVVSVEKLHIVQDSSVDYSELCRQQMELSKIGVIYFKYSSDWALPFTQEIWKRIGGASSNTPLLLIGDENPEENRTISFKAPKVISLVVAGELIPLEIKVMYDKLVGNN